MAATVPELAGRVLRRLGVSAVAAADRAPNATGLVDFKDIGRLSLQRLGVVAANEAPEPADAEVATFTAQAVHHGLVGQGLAAWGNGNAVPSAVAEEYTILVALHLAPLFGKEADPAAATGAEMRIRRISMVAKSQGDAEQAVMDVHAWLDATGRARWGVWDIPDYAEGPYVALAANRVAPQFEMPVDQVAEARALRELAQAIALPSTGETMRPEWF